MHLESTTQGTLVTKQWIEVAPRRDASASRPFPATPLDELSRAQQSDPVALSALLRRYSGPIESIARSQGSHKNDVSDIKQRALTRVWRGLHGFRRERPGAFRAWLNTIVQNLIRDVRREHAKLALLGEPFAQAELERQLAESHARCGEREARRRRALTIMDCVWQRLADKYAKAGEQELFEYLLESIYTGNTDRDLELSRKLADSDGYLAKRRHDLKKVEHRKELRAEYLQRCWSQRAQGSARPPTFKEWTRALDDDLR